MLEKQVGLAQDAVILGTLLDCFFLDNRRVGFTRGFLKTLPKFLTYRIPLIRGNEQPHME